MLNRTFFRTQLINRPLKFKSSNESFKLTWPIPCSFCVQFVSILYFINVSVIQNFVLFRLCLFAAFLSFAFLDRWRQLSLLPRLKITVFSKNVKVNVKLIYTIGLGVHFFPIWNRLQISWRHFPTQYPGVKSDRTIAAQRYKSTECYEICESEAIRPLSSMTVKFA